jgi:hypothetical protein
MSIYTSISPLAVYLIILPIQRKSRVLVAHAYNLSYSGGRDQRDHGSKIAWAKQFARPYLKKNPITKKG